MSVNKGEPAERLTLFLGGFEIDWTLVLIAFWLRGLGAVGLAVAAAALGLRVCSSRKLTIGVEAGSVYYSVTRLWQRERAGCRTVVAGAVLRHWCGWFCRGFELRGSQLSLFAAARGGKQLRPPSEIRATRGAHPPVRLRARAIALNLPNVLLLSASLVAIRDVVSWITVLVFWSGLFGIVASLAAILRGAPTFSVVSNRPGAD